MIAWKEYDPSTKIWHGSLRRPNIISMAMKHGIGGPAWNVDANGLHDW